MRKEELTKDIFKQLERKWIKEGKIMNVSAKDDLGYIRAEANKT
jgi:hypothetical protein